MRALTRLVLFLSTACQTQQQNDGPVRMFDKKVTKSAQPNTRDPPRVQVKRKGFVDG